MLFEKRWFYSNKCQSSKISDITHLITLTTSKKSII